MKKLKNKVTHMMALMMIISCFSINVCAAPGGTVENLNTNTTVENEKGSLLVRIPDIEGLNIHLAKIADIVDGHFVMIEEYEKLGVDLNDIENSEELEKEINKIDVTKLSGVKVVTDNKGEALFKDLEIGAYMVYSDNPKDKEQVESTIISVPKYDEESGEMIFDVTVLPKHEKPLPPNEAPQTSLKDHAKEYAFVGLVCAALGAGFMILTKKKK